MFERMTLLQMTVSTLTLLHLTHHFTSAPIPPTSIPISLTQPPPFRISFSLAMTIMILTLIPSSIDIAKLVLRPTTIFHHCGQRRGHLLIKRSVHQILFHLLRHRHQQPFPDSLIPLMFFNITLLSNRFFTIYQPPIVAFLNPPPASIPFSSKPGVYKQNCFTTTIVAQYP